MPESGGSNLSRHTLSELSSWALRLVALAIAAYLTLQSDVSQWRGAFTFGFAFVGVAIGVYLTFRILSFPDLTIEGSYALGGCVVIALIRYQEGNIFGNPWVATIVAALCGALAGLATGLIHTRFKVNGILAGILVAAALYSINLRTMNNQAILATNLTSNPSTILDHVTTTLTGQPDPRRLLGTLEGDYLSMGFMALIALLLVLGINWLLNTELGFALRATGDNENMIRALGVNTDNAKILVLMLSNGLIALCGALVAQYQRNASITAGQGIIVTGVAAVIIGETFLPPSTTLFALTGAVIGAIVYRFIFSAVFNLSLTQAVGFRMLVTIVSIIFVSWLAYLTMNVYTPRWITVVSIFVAAFVGALLSSLLYYLPVFLFKWDLEKTQIVKLESGDIQIALALLVFIALIIPGLRRNLGLKALTAR
jgi:putative ABC transport system permease protein